MSESKLPSSPDWYRNTLAPDVHEAGFPEVAKDIIALADEVSRLDKISLALTNALAKSVNIAEQEGYAAGMLDAEAARSK